MPDGRYSLTIYVAAPGTPLKSGGTSLPGHMYFATEDDVGRVESYGFAPVVHGRVNGLGGRALDDVQQYKDPLYARTVEVTKDQFDRVNEFGQDAKRFGFDMQYKDVRNNCVDFTWAALDHAGIKHQRYLSVPTFGGFGPDVRIPTGIDGVGKGALRPAQNVKDIQSIDAPVPGSPLNREHRNPMPEGRSLLQRLLSDERMLDRPDHPANGMYLQALDGIGKLNAEHGVAASPRDTRFAGSLTVAATAEGMRGDRSRVDER